MSTVSNVWTGRGRVLAAGLAILLGLTATVAVHAQARNAAAAPEESRGPNTGIQRWAEGEYAYRALKDGRDRGWERFRMTVHPDGTRSMLMWHGLRARSSQFTVQLRVEPSFRPLEAYVSYWNDGKFKGSASMFVTGGTLELVSHGAWGTYRERATVPDGFTIGTHPIAADGWHAWVADAFPGSPGRVYGLEAGVDLMKPIRGTVRDTPIEKLGRERIRVPAGEFETTRYRIAGTTEVWLHGEDRLLVRMRNERFDRDYVLTTLTTGR